MVRISAFLIRLGDLRPRPLPRSACQTYRLVYQTVYDQQQVTAYRIETETVYDEQQQTTYRPVYETEMRERRYTVARPVTETSEREERYRVMRPVWETQMRDSSYDVVRTVAETSEREERYMVARPVYETQEREERQIVRRQVVETAERDEASTVVEPVTTYTTNYVDQGQFVDQQVVTPGRVHTASALGARHVRDDPYDGRVGLPAGRPGLGAGAGSQRRDRGSRLAAECRGPANAANHLRGRAS